MKSYLVSIFIIFLVFFFSCKSENQQTPQSQASKIAEVDSQKFEITYDKALAQKLGADDYGMKTYVMAFLKAGPNRSEDSSKAAALQRAHLNNINRMAKEGTLVLAGPFLDSTALRGIYLFNVETVKEAQELTKTDPMVQQGALVFEFHPWYGAAVLPLVNDWYKKVAKKGI